MKNKYLLVLLVLLNIVFSMGRTPFWKSINERFLGQTERLQSIYIDNLNNQAELLLNSKEDLNDLLNFCTRKKHPVTTIYLEIPNYEVLKNELNNFIDSLSKHNISAYYIFNLGPAISPATVDELNKFVSFNATFQNGFQGIHFEYQTSSNAFTGPYLDNYLAFLEKTKQVISRLKNKIAISSNLPVSFGNSQLNEKYQPLFFNYLNTALLTFNQPSTEEDIKLADQLIDYAEEIKTDCNVYLNLDLNLALPERINLYKKQLGELEKLQKKYKIFKTIALNYTELKNSELLE